MFQLELKLGTAKYCPAYEQQNSRLLKEVGNVRQWIFKNTQETSYFALKSIHVYRET